MTRVDVARSAPPSADRTPAAVELVDIRLARSGRTVLEEASLTVAPGRLVVLMGPSGSGKTTLLSLINRLVDPDAGAVRVHGQDVAATPPHLLRRKIGYCFQGLGLFPHLSVAENIAITPHLLGWDAKKKRERAATLLERVHLDDSLASRLPSELSGGQAQRVALARALAAEPPLLLLDEPFAALDAETRERLQDLLGELHHSLGMTTILTSHNLAEALRLGTELAVLSGGRIAQMGAPAEVVGNPVNADVAALFAPAQRNAKIVTGSTSPAASTTKGAE